MQCADFATARAKASEARRLAHGVATDAVMEPQLKMACDFYAPLLEGEAQFWLGDYPAAEAAAQKSIEVRDQYPVLGLDEARATQMVHALKALAIARQGRTAEAASLIGPVVEYQRGLAARNKGDVTQRLELAQALYVQSLTDRPRHAALRREALAIIDEFPQEFRKLHSVTRWRQVIQSSD